MHSHAPSSNGYPFISYIVESLPVTSTMFQKAFAVLEISMLYSSVNLPVVLDRYNPDMDGLPEIVLAWH